MVKNFKSKKGAIMPLLVIFLAFIGFGITAIVVDAGSLYAEKKAMVTAADAGALAGAEVLEKAGAANYDAKKALAEETARNIAMANGAASSPAIFIGYDPTYNRKVIRVTCNVAKDTFFARLMHGNEGDETASVRADAVATWGYDMKYTAENIIPIFVLDTSFVTNSSIQIKLHDQFSNSPPNYGFIDMGNGTLKDWLTGDRSADTIDTVLNNQTGNQADIVGGITNRLISAQEKFPHDPAAKKKFMTGLIPIILTENTVDGREGFYDLNNIDEDSTEKWSSGLQLPVNYFAYFVIEDVIKQNKHNGVPESLYSSAYDHPFGGVKGIEYLETEDDYVSTISLPGETIQMYGIASEGAIQNEPVIIGRFTGKIKPRVSAVDGDQEDPDPNVDGEATYSKLIE